MRALLCSQQLYTRVTVMHPSPPGQAQSAAQTAAVTHRRVLDQCSLWWLAMLGHHRL